MVDFATARNGYDDQLFHCYVLCGNVEFNLYLDHWLAASFTKPWVLWLSAGTTFDSSMTTTGTNYNLGDITIYRIYGEMVIGIPQRLYMTLEGRV